MAPVRSSFVAQSFDLPSQSVLDCSISKCNVKFYSPNTSRDDHERRALCIQSTYNG